MRKPYTAGYSAGTQKNSAGSEYGRDTARYSGNAGSKVTGTRKGSFAAGRDL